MTAIPTVSKNPWKWYECEMYWTRFPFHLHQNHHFQIEEQITHPAEIRSAQKNKRKKLENFHNIIEFIEARTFDRSHDFLLAFFLYRGQKKSISLSFVDHTVYFYCNNSSCTRSSSAFIGRYLFNCHHFLLLRLTLSLSLLVLRALRTGN